MNLNVNCLVKITYKNHAGITHEYVIRPQELFWGQSKFYTHPQLLLKSLKVIEDGHWEHTPVVRDFTVSKIYDWQELDIKAQRGLLEIQLNNLEGEKNFVKANMEQLMKLCTHPSVAKANKVHRTDHGVKPKGDHSMYEPCDFCEDCGWCTSKESQELS